MRNYKFVMSFFDKRKKKDRSGFFMIIFSVMKRLNII